MSAEKQVEKEIREAIVFLREKNHTIPSETIEFMKQASLKKLKNINKNEPEQAKDNSQSINVEKHTSTAKRFTITTPHLNMKVDYDDVNHNEVDAATETLQFILENFWDEEFFINAKKRLIMEEWHKNEYGLQQLYEEEGGVDGFKRDNGI